MAGKKLKFTKYQGTGNDFVMLNAFKDKEVLNLKKNEIKSLCDRRLGIGGDGLIILAPSDSYDFEMIYYNADGKESSMCGNGGRCIVHWARALKYIEKETVFKAIDGLHHAEIEGEEIRLKMKDVVDIVQTDEFTTMDTGSPHYIKMVRDLDFYKVVPEGKKIRYSPEYKTKGINVNFVELKDNIAHVRTYERGVEDETLSCGTGVTAAAIALHANGHTEDKVVNVHTPGGTLQIQFHPEIEKYIDIWLIGPAEKVFEGVISL